MTTEDMTTPPGPWMDPQIEEPAALAESEFHCDECGHDFEKKQGLTMHKTITHGVPGQRKVGRPKGSKSKPKPTPTPSAPQRIVLREVYADGGENGRILLTDQAGNWWIARKLDV